MLFVSRVIGRSSMHIGIAHPSHRLASPDQNPHWIEADMAAFRVAAHMDFDHFGRSERGPGGDTGRKHRASCAYHRPSAQDAGHFSTDASSALLTCQRTM